MNPFLKSSVAAALTAGALCLSPTPARATSLALNDTGVVVDNGADGRLELTFPALVGKDNKDRKVMDKAVAGRKATLKFEGGGQLDLELGAGEFVIKPSGIPAEIAKLHLSMLVSAEYNRGGKWSIAGSEAKTFPKDKPAKPFLYQGNANTLELTNPTGVVNAFRIPDYSYQQLQDNREWNWSTFQWHVWIAYNPDAPRYVIKLGAPADAAAAPVKRTPIVDRFGQDVKEKIANRLADEAELKKDVDEEKAYFAALNPPPTDRFGGLPDSGAKLGLAKTGFFHVEKKGERWILVDPDGNAFFHLGVCSFGPTSYTYVTGRESSYEWIPPHDGEFATAWAPDKFWNPSSISYHSANLIRKYGEPVTLDSFQERMIPRVRKWGFNSIGAFSGASQAVVSKLDFPYVSHLPAASDWNGIPSLPDIRETFDPFDEKIKAEVEKQFAKNLPPRANDPLLIGYFLANEPTHEAVPRVIPTLKNLPVKRRLVQFLEEKYGTVAACNEAWGIQFADFKTMEGTGLPVTTRKAADDMQAFTALFFETYYRFIAETFHKYDTKHMLIGSRWQPGTANNEQLCRIAGKYLDVISVNYYTYGIDKDFLKRIYTWCGSKPMMLTEFYWTSSSDSGLGPFKDVNSQEERGLAYRNYLEQSAALGYIVGIEWFTLVDAPRTGNWFSRYDGERSNTGLISVTDRPWKSMLTEMMKSNYDVYKVEFGERQPFVFNDPRFTGAGAGGKRKITIARTPQPLVMDGNRGDWPGLPPEMISAKRLVEGADAGGLEAQFRMCWDEENLYLHVEVTDATPMQNQNTGNMLWSGDGIELFIGSENLDQGGALQFADRQIMLGAGAADGQGQVWLLNAPKQLPCKLATTTRVDGKGYALEAAIPFAALGFSPAKGQELLFDLAVDDSTTGKGRKCQLMWNGISRNSTDRGAWGRAVLGE